MATRTVKQSGGDFTTLASALADASTASGDTIEISGSWTADDTAAATVADTNITITAIGSSKCNPYAASSPSHYRLRVAGTAPLSVGSSGCTITGVEIKMQEANDARCIVVTAGTITLTVQECLFYCGDTSKTGTRAIYVTEDDCTINLRQVAMYDIRAGAVSFYAGNNARNITVNINSCTFWNVGHSGAGATGYTGIVGIYTSSTAPDSLVYMFNTLVRQCTVASNYTGSFCSRYADVLYVTADRCCVNHASDDWSYNDLVNMSSVTDCKFDMNFTDDNTKSSDGDWIILTDITTSTYKDMRLQSNTYNEAQDLHADSTGASQTMPSTDFIGTTRPANTNYDCGCFEIAVSGTVYTFTVSAIGESDTPTPVMGVLRTITSSSTGESDSSTTLLNVLRILVALATGETDTPTIDLVLVKLFTALCTGESDTPTPILQVLRAITSLSTGESDTPDTVILRVLRLLTSLSTGESDTPTPILRVLRLLTSASTGESDTPDTVILRILRAITSLSTGESDTPDTVLLNVLRLITSLSVGESDTPTINLNVGAIILFTALMTGESSTSDTSILSVLRKILSGMVGESDVSWPVFRVLRLLTSASTGETLTSDVILRNLVLFLFSSTGESTTSTPTLRQALAFIAAITGESDTASAVLRVLRTFVSSPTGESDTALVNLYAAVLVAINDPTIVLTKVEREFIQQTLAICISRLTSNRIINAVSSCSDREIVLIRTEPDLV